MTVEKDVELLEVAVEKAEERDDETAQRVFGEWLDNFRQGRWFGDLTPKQRAWAEAVAAGKRYDPDPEYLNLVSSGKAPRGREVELMVKDKPLRPPPRRSE